MLNYFTIQRELINFGVFLSLLAGIFSPQTLEVTEDRDRIFLVCNQESPWQSWCKNLKTKTLACDTLATDLDPWTFPSLSVNRKILRTFWQTQITKPLLLETTGTGEMARWFRALPSFLADPVWFSAPTWWLTTVCNFTPRRSDAPSWTVWLKHVHSAYTHGQHTHVEDKNQSF